MKESGFDAHLIAPCGMNCGICKVHLRRNNSCPGCNSITRDQPGSRVQCRLRLCDQRKGTFCSACAEFPCGRLRHLDSRNRARYGMSEIENLEYIRDHGMEEFLENERRKWVSDNGILCVHDKKYYMIGEDGSDVTDRA